MRMARAAALVASALLFAGPAPAAVTSSFTARGPESQGTLRIAGDAADDSIVVGCVGAFVLINGAAPDTGPLRCTQPVTIEVAGGGGVDWIDLGGIAPAQTSGVFRGISAYASVEGGEGDDVIVGPSGGLASIVGGPGSDWMQGRSIDRYVFGPAVLPEHDTVVEPGGYECEPSYFDSNQPGLSYWTVPWDALDFRALGTGEPVTVDERAPAGLLAMHGNRTISIARSRGGTAIEAIAGGAAGDRIVAACMAVGGAGDDVLEGTASDGDLLVGGDGNDRLNGGGGSDTLKGGPGADELNGGPGEDALAGGPGGDGLSGGVDGDTYLFDSRAGPADVVRETAGPGIDVLSFEFDAADSVRVDLSVEPIVAQARNLEVRVAEPGTARFFEGVVGGAGDDRLIGHAGPNHFWGGGGTDLVAGGRGDDVYHVDWVSSMPYGAYDWGEVWNGPFDRGVLAQRSVWLALTTPSSLLRIAEATRGGFDTIDLADQILTSTGSASRLESQLDRAHVDLSAADWIIREEHVGARTARRGDARHLEGVRGTTGPDVLIGNAANNVLEGRQGRDRISGGRGRDTCITAGDGDELHGCERVRREHPDRRPAGS